MFDILINNYLLLINLAIPFILGLYFVIKHTEYSPKEFLIQISLTVIIITSAFAIGYVGSDIYTKSYKNAYIDSFVYEESWTERVTYTESYKCGKSTCVRTKTRYDYHSDKYYYTVDGGFAMGISKNEYNRAKQEFGEYLTNRKHSGQSSSGDGRIYDVLPTKRIVHTDYDNEINYIYASKKNIIKSYEYKHLEEQFKNELQEYPQLYSDYYGNTNFDRVINPGLISSEIVERLQKDLEQISMAHNVNPMIYLTTSESREFAYVVKGFYKDRYYNDAMLVVGVKDNKILWTEPISLSKSAEFKVYSTNLTDTFNDLMPKFNNVIAEHWVKPNLNEYKYLAGDINLPFWYEMIVVLINIIGSFFVFRYMFNHRI